MNNEKRLPVPKSEETVLNNLIRDLTETYPDGVIRNFQKEHKNWYEKVSRLYKNIGYDSREAFLSAYGFVEEKAKTGRPSNDLNAIVEELISRYEGDKTAANIDQLKEDNPDLAPKFKSLQNKAKDLFGMTFVKYLKEKGVIQGAKSSSEDLQTKVSATIGELKLRYQGKPLPKSISEIIKSNGDITDIARLSPWIQKAYGRPALEYLVEQGLVEKKEEHQKPEKTEEQIAASNFRKLPVDQKLKSITDSLKARTAQDGKPADVKELCEKYDDLPAVGTIRKWTRDVFGVSADEYFMNAGIIMTPHEQYLDYLAKVMDYNSDQNDNEEIKGAFYDYYDYIDTKALMKDVAGSEDEALIPKNKKVNVQIGNQSFVVKNKLGTGIKKFGVPDNGFFFDLKVAELNILDPEEVGDRMLRVSDSSDAWVYAKPIVDPDAKAISKADVRKRYRTFAALAHVISKEDVLQKICETAPKKKNGSLHKNRILRIASTATVEAEGYDKNDILYSDHSIWEMVAKADSDNELSVYIDRRQVSDSELESVRNDFISSQWVSLELDKFMTTEGQEAIGIEQEELFRIDGDRLFLNNVNGKDEFLQEFKTYRSACIDDDEICVRFPSDGNCDNNAFTIDDKKMRNSIQDAWSNMLASGGLYDFKDWKKKSEKARKQVHRYSDDFTVTDFIPVSHEPGDPKSDCRALKVKKYNLKESVLKFAKLIDSFAEKYDHFIESVPRKPDGSLKVGAFMKFFDETKDLKKEEFFIFPPAEQLNGFMESVRPSHLLVSLVFWKKR